MFPCSAVHILLVFAGVEEGACVILSERVVRVHESLRILSCWGLDVPESVVWDCVQNAVGCGTLEGPLERIL